ncbi:MAG TPA: 2OG-Fe(II) oxygenase [Dehalococcoidia bacterium]|nr:2OG-Fe(II) oxygenase [Dehalococcoidia bacterium]
MNDHEPLATRLAGIDWAAVEAELEARGWAHRPGLLDPTACRHLAALFDDKKRFRSTVEMERHNYGSGTYRYFRYPLPDLVQTLREELYRRLAPIANRWRERVMRAEPFPPALDEFLARCQAAGQRRPTPLLLAYEAGGYNALHRDIYGKVAFPLQAVIILSRRATEADPGDFAGGEFLLTEEPKDAPGRPWAVAATQGDLIVFATKFRPERIGDRWRQLPLRHGAQTITAGHRRALGIIFHDAK